MQDITIKLNKIRDVKTPERGSEQSAGIDFFIPEFDESFIEKFLHLNDNIYIDDKLIRLNPSENVLIPSGIELDLSNDKNVVMFMKNKSSVASQCSLDVMACVIDQDYQDEFMISLINNSYHEIDLYSRMKIVQGVLLPVYYPELQIFDGDQNFYENKTGRGKGGFGSTGNGIDDIQ